MKQLVCLFVTGEKSYGGQWGGSNSGDPCRYGYSSIVNLSHCGSRLNSACYITPQQMGAIGSGNGGLGACNSGGNYERVELNSVPVVQWKSAAKRLRLFGVNMECPLSEYDEQDVELSSTSISHVQNQHPQHQQHPQLHSLSSSNSSSGFQNPLPQSAMSMPAADFSNEGKSRSMSLDLDI